MGYDGTLKFDTKIDSSGFESGLGKLSSLAGTAVKTIAAISAAGVAAFGAVTKSSLDSVASLEQNIGGIETLFKDSADTVISNAKQAFATAGMSANEYMQTVTSFAAALIQGASKTAQQTTEADTEAMEEALDEQYQAEEKALDKQYDLRADALDRQYDQTKKALDKQYDLRADELSRQYDQAKKTYEKQYDALSDAISDEIEAMEKANDKKLDNLRKSQEKEVEAFEKATEKKIALIDKEYTESLKLIDKEEYARIKAIDEQIARLNGQTEAEQAAQEKAEQEQRKVELQKAINTARTVAEREAAEKKLSDYLAQLALKERQRARKEQVEQLKEQKSAIKEQTSNQKEALKEQHTQRVNAVKSSRSAELKALKASHKEELEAEKEKNAATLKAFKKGKEAQLKSLKEAQENQLAALKRSQDTELKTLKEAQADQLDALKRSQDAEKKAIRDANEEKLNELKKYIKAQKEAIKKGNDDVADSIGITAEARAEAARIADMAAKDMSDNANKFGTPLRDIQNAYQGFAKQNYTMLDNLKLGYGGTKTEMERLLADAEKLSGVHYDVNNLGDVYTAIHVIQEELGITDATAEEAKSTIEGSLGALKAAWDNFLSGAGTPKELVDSFDVAAGNIAKALAEIIPRLLETLPTVIAHAASTVVSEFCKQIGVSADSDDTTNAATEIVTALVNRISERAPDVTAVTASIITNLASGIVDNIPLIFDSARQIIEGLLKGLEDQFPGVAGFLEGFFDGFLDTAEEVVTDVVEILKGIFEAVNGADPKTMKEVGRAIGTIVAAFIAFNTAKSALGIFSSLFKIIGTGKSTITTISGVVSKVIEGFQLWQGGAGTLAEVFATQFPKMSAIVSGAIKAITSPLAGIAMVIGGAIIAVKNFVDMFQNGFSVVKEVLMVVGIAIAAVGAVILGAPIAVAAVVAGIIAAVATLVIVIKEHWDEIVAAFNAWIDEWKRLGHDLKQFFLDAGEWIKKKVSDAINSVVKFFSGLPGNIQSHLTNTVKRITNWAKEIASNAKTAATTFVNNVITFFKQLPGNVQSWLLDTIRKIVAWGVDIAFQARSAASTFLNNVVSFFKNLPGNVWTWLTNTVNNIVTFGRNLATQGRNAAVNFFNSFINIVTSLPGQMLTIGKNIVTGVWNGICNAYNWFWDRVMGFFSGIVDGVCKFLGINSPSRVFADKVGKAIPEGVGVGIEAAMPGLLKQTRQQMSILSESMKTTVEMEAGKISFQQIGQQEYERALAERQNQHSVHVTGQLEGDRPSVTHVTLNLDKKKFAEEITPSVNHEMYKIDSRENNRGRGVVVPT